MSFEEMWIPCTVEEYPEVKQLLEGMGLHVIVMRDVEEWIELCAGVMVWKDGDFMAVLCTGIAPTVTLPELREMAKRQTTPHTPIGSKQQIIDTLYKCAKITHEEGGVKIERWYEKEAQAILKLFNQSK